MNVGNSAKFGYFEYRNPSNGASRVAEKTNHVNEGGTRDCINIHRHRYIESQQKVKEPGAVKRVPGIYQGQG